MDTFYRPKTTTDTASGSTQIPTTNWPVSTNGVITAGDVFRFELSPILNSITYDDEYTVSVASSKNSNSAGGLTITFSPALTVNIPAGTGILFKNPRALTADMKASVSAEKSTMCYFLQFNFYNSNTGREELSNLNTSVSDMLFNWFDYESSTAKISTDGIQFAAASSLSTKNWSINSKTIQRGQILTFANHTQTYTAQIPTSHASVTVNGTGQTGSFINLQGFVGLNNGDIVLRAGDIIIITGATPSTCVVKYNVAVNGSGQCTVPLAMQITGAPANGAAVDVSNYTYYSDSAGKVTIKISPILESQLADNTQLAKKWVGVGGNLTFRTITESNDLAAQGTDIILSGVDQSLIALLLQKKYIGRHCMVFLAHINSNGVVVSDPKMIFWGRMNGGYDVEENRDTETPGTVDISLRAVDRMGDLNLVRGIQTNLESHQKIDPTSTFFKYVDTVAGKIIRWGPG